MPPRRDTSGSDEFPPSVSDQLNQLIQISTTAATTQSDIKTQIAALVQATANLNTKLDSQTETTARLVNHVTELTDSIQADKPPPDRPHTDRPVGRTVNQPPRQPKITLPLFDGSNPLGWMFQADHYFAYYNIPPAERISLTAFHFIGDALSWYQHQSNNNLLGNWTDFKREVELRFGPSTYENHEATLFKLQQTASVSEYQTEFEKISNRITGLSQQNLRNCFISGLRSDIQSELAILKPTSYHDACGLARAVEEKFTQPNKPKPFLPPRSSTSYNSSPSTTISPTSQASSSITSKTTNSTAPPLLPSPPKPLPFTKLSPEAIQQRRKDGLCFRCPEIFFPGHKCSPPQFLLIVDNEDFPSITDTPQSDQVEDLQPPQFMSLSDAAFFGMCSTQMLRITGYIKGKPVTILIDCGSTHNIIQPRIASALRLSTKSLQPFAVMVGNGQLIHCEGHCPDVQVQLQKETFQIPFFIFPVQGADVVLGISWLATLGRLTADFSIPEISFKTNGTTTTLRGEPLGQPVTPSSLSSLIRHGSVASLHALLLDDTSHPPHAPTGQTSPTHADPNVTSLLENFQTLFDAPHTLPPNRPHDHNIPLFNDNNPINVKPYRYPHFQKRIMTQLIGEMLNDGIIRPSQSPFSSPVLLVKKKDGTWRFCVDYRALNAVTVKDRFPIPTIDELLDELHGATIFSKIDLPSGYHQIRVAEKDIHKTAFRTTDGHYEFLVMPFGLTNAPSTFQSAMKDLFRPVLRRFVLVFFDDILIYSGSKEEHYNHLRYVFDALLQHQFHAKASKCVFAVSEISFLGHRISCKGVSPEPDKIASIQQWPTPNSFTTLRAFLGLTGYYRRFVPNYAKTATPLTDILKQKVFVWSDEVTQAFTTLKSHMQDLVTLALPDFTKPFDLTTDASGQAIGAVLSQNNRPVAFYSKKLCPTMQAQSTYTKELYAITESVRKWRQYLLGRRFRIFTDHHSLKHMLTQTINTPEQQKWITKLLGYDFEIHFKPGKENTVADALSRVDYPSLLALSYPTAPWLNEIRGYFKDHVLGKQLVQQITTDPTGFPHHSVRDGLVYLHGKILVPPIPTLRDRLLEEFHSSFLGGHSGIHGTFKRISTSFAWLGLKRDVTAYVKKCSVCQATKTPTHHPYGLLQPLPVPVSTWIDISMDFITGLPSSKGKTTIWVIVDRLSKFAHFISLPTHYTAVSLASIFMKEIYRLHGLPKTIVSDRDPTFVSCFWKELFKHMGTKLLHSSAYHPQTDGQTEVVNRCLESYLRAFVFDEPATWGRYLYLAEFSYNTSHHSSINMTPFKAVYGRDATTIHDYIPGSSNNASIDTSLATHQQLLELLKGSLEQARERMVRQANKKRLEKEFQVGDWVFLKLQQYRQSSVSDRKNQKLSKRFFGPYKILERIGKLAYKLDLPATSRIHPIFHVSLLKPSYGTTSTTTDTLDNFQDDEIVDLLPEDVINNRIGLDNQQQSLVKWEGRPLEEATWEDTQDFRNRFPFFRDIEDNVASLGEGDDTDQVGPSAKQAQLQHNVNDRPKRQVKKPNRLME
ncbi:putative nucleotidyltransferase, Ribonuclease H [Helianthus annuus]|nr:putative nucleotidyltransferase, Ribonuclease H [Helianthus annuus]